MWDKLRKSAILGVIDYQMLMSTLSGYKAPHRKITEMLRKQELIRIKKGLYLLGEHYRDEIPSELHIANLIYGPSYVSKEFALQHYGLIPERVTTVTSMTPKRHKHFHTPLGDFTYDYINLPRFTVGVDRIAITKQTPVLIASPEKAIVDTIARFSDITTEETLRQHLIENLRMDHTDLKKLKLNRIKKISDAYQLPVITLLYYTLKQG